MNIKKLNEELDKLLESDYDSWLYRQADDYMDPLVYELELDGLSCFDIVVLENGEEKTYTNIPLYYHKNVDLSDDFSSPPRWSTLENYLDEYMDFDNQYFEEYDDHDDPDYPLPPNYTLVKVLGFAQGSSVEDLIN